MKNAIRFAGIAVAVALMGQPMLADDNSGKTTADQQQNADQSSRMSRAASLTQRGNMSEKDFDGHFVMDAIQDNTAEIQMAKIAEQKTQDPQIKQFAQMLIQDHTQADQQLRQLAVQKGFAVPQQLNEVKTAKLAEAEKKSGPDFDRHFVFGQVADHVKDVLCYRNAAELASDPQLKQWIEQSIPVLHRHLHEARELAGGEDATTAGAHLHGSSADRQDNASGSGSK